MCFAALIIGDLYKTYFSISEPMVSNNELDPIQYTLPTAGLYAFTQTDQQKPSVRHHIIAFQDITVNNIHVTVNKSKE